MHIKELHVEFYFLFVTLSCIAHAKISNDFNHKEIDKSELIESLKTHQYIDSVELKEVVKKECHADSFINKGEFSEALTFLFQANKIREAICGTENLEYISNLVRMLYCLYEIGDYERAIEIGEKAKNIIERMGFADNIDFVVTISKLADCYSSINNHVEAIQLRNKVLSIYKEELYTDCHEYATEQISLANDFAHISNYKEAILHSNEAKEIFKILYGIDNINYAITLYNLASFYYETGNYEESVKLWTEAGEILKRIYGTDCPEYAIVLTKLAVFNLTLGNYENASNYIREALNIQERIIGTYHRDYAESLNILANIKADMGNYEEAIRIGTEALYITGKISGQTDDDYAIQLSNLADYYSLLGNDSEAIKMQTRAINILSNHVGLTHPSCASILRKLAECQRGVRNYREAVRHDSLAMNIDKQTLGTKHPHYAYSLSSLALDHLYLGDYTIATELGKEATEIVKEAFGKESTDYAKCLSHLSGCYFGLHDYTEAKRLLIIASKIYEKKYGPKSPDYIGLLFRQSVCDIALNRVEDALKVITSAINIESSNAVKFISNASPLLKEAYWIQEKNVFFHLLPKLIFLMPSPNNISFLYNNTALLAKNLLLNTEKLMKKQIKESGDSVLMKEFCSLQTNYMILGKQFYKQSILHQNEIDSLIHIIKKQENDLAEKTNNHDTYLSYSKITWKDIKNYLHQNEIAIEFIEIPLVNDNKVYVALSVRKDSESPKMITLFEEKQLIGFPDSLHYQCKEMTNLVWKPLQAELEGIKNIYFSPSGALYNIGIEYLPGMENYNIYRLSSTRELVTSKQTETKNRAVLYGGLNYDADFDKSVTDKSLALLDETFVERAYVRGMGLRGGKEYLKHTKEEVDIIGEEFNKANWECIIDSAAMGTEESFKALSGRRIGCLHISTHGFYYTQEDAENALYKFMLIDNNLASAEDKALTRSGLVLSGANHILEDEELPDNVEDGILTAKEIADVDLRGLDLVVLSACQTGLGDIEQGEGVFGLQRGFKKAGANSILMSLWEVDDKATQILMTQFYRNLLFGQSKRQSLLNAQKNLREYWNANGEQCYNSPKYWAAFILLDGFDKKLEDN